MKHLRLGLVSVLAVSVLPLLPSEASAACPWVGSTAAPATKAAQVLARMTLAEKVALVSGDGSTGPEAATLRGVRRLCIPDLVTNDAGAGIGNRQTGTTALPDTISQAATWDPALVQRLGSVLGAEAVAKGVNTVFAPGVNLSRTPLGGRGFEYAGEDPFLAGQTAAAVVRGVQSQHVVATVKHFALNDQESDRDTVSANADERTVQELHVPAFEAAVKAGAGAVMCAYNKVNTVYSCQNPSLLTSVLRRQLGFTGMVVSDFGATHSTVASARAGLDVELPAGRFYGDALLSAVRAGRVPTATLDTMVTHVLTTMFRIGIVDHPPTPARATATTATSIKVANSVAQDGSVLLKNTGAALPITNAVRSVAVIGAAADELGSQKASQGYGSAHVPQFGYAPRVKDPLAAIRERAASYGATVTYADGKGRAKALLAAAQAEVAVVFVNDVENEGVDRPDLTARTGSCSITGTADCTYDDLDQDALVRAVASVNPRTVVVLQTGGPVTMPWLADVEAVLENWYPGQTDGGALAPLLWGDVNPSGKLPVTFPVQLSDGPVQTAAQYPGVDKGAAYAEKLLVGYRWYDAQSVVPLFPFGHGLSYTTFRYSGLTATATGARFTVTNTGTRAGSEVAQVYVGAPATAGEPPRQLKGFTKVALAPGRSTTVTVPLTGRSFSVWDVHGHRWKVVAGCWKVSVGGSSRSLPQTRSVPVAGGRC